MNDARIEQLLRMAVEADEMEDACEGRSPVIARLRNGKVTMLAARRRMWAGLALAACAALAFAGAWVIGVRSGTPRPDSGGLAMQGSKRVPAASERGLREHAAPARIEVVSKSTAPARPGAGVVSDGPEQSVVLAIYHDPYVGCQCVKWRPHDWAGNRCLSEVGAQEIKGVDVGRPCMPAARQKLLVALSGPEKDLPANDAQATELAECILGGDRMCDTDGTCYEPAARECVPKSVSFKIETVAYNR